MAFNLKDKRTALQKHITQTKKYHAELEAKGEGNVTQEEANKFQAMIDDGRAMRKEYEELKELHEIDQELNQPDGERRSKAGANAPRSWGQRVVESEQYKTARSSRGQRKEMDRVEVGSFKEFIFPRGQKDLYGSTDATGGAFVVEFRDPELVDLPQRPRSILDLINIIETESDAVEYVEVTSRDNQAAPTAEYTGGDFGIAPESNLVFALKTANIKRIPTFVSASRQILDDAPQLRGIIDTELRYMVREELEDQVLAGDGTGENLTGINNASGIQTRTQGATGDRGGEAGDTKADAIRRALTDIRLEFYDANGILVNPGDGEDLELQKDANSNYLNVYDPVAMRIWRVPVVETKAQTAGVALIGNFFLGATLYDRKQTEVLVGQPNDYFLRSAVAVLAEIRAGLAVKRPLAFEKLTFA